MIRARKLRVLIITDAVGGVWVYSLELARALAPLGIEAMLAVVGPEPTDKQRTEAKGIRLIETGLPLDWEETTPAELAHAGQALAAIASRMGVDIVQTCSAAILAEAEFKQPTVAVQHSCVASWWTAVRGMALPSDFAWRTELVGRGLRRSAAVVAPSAAFAAETGRIYRIQNIATVHNGRCLAALPDNDGHKAFVLTASRLWDEGKNVVTLDAAAALLNHPFLAAGALSGPHGANISVTHLEALGHIDSAAVATLLRERPIFASAALYEPFGLSVLEAAQSGCALVLSDIPTHRELWSGAAMFVPARDSEGFASAVRRLLDDETLRNSFGAAAQSISGRYVPQAMAAAMASIYAKALAQAATQCEPLQLAGAA